MSTRDIVTIYNTGYQLQNFRNITIISQVLSMASVR